MAKIKISDLPENTKISEEELKKVFGGFGIPSTQLFNASIQNSLSNHFQSSGLLGSGIENKRYFKL
jgi:hypothetical protein